MKPATDLNRTTLTEALKIVGNPDARHNCGLRLLAWAALKSASGQPIRQVRTQMLMQG